MKVLLFNGSPREKGCTYTALSVVAEVLGNEGIETEIIQTISDDTAFVKEVHGKMKEADALVLGSPVYYASPTGVVQAFMDKFAGIAGADLRLKPAAVVASARRAGTTATLDVLMKYLTINEMPIISGNYWPMVHGNTPADVMQDQEGLDVLTTLATNMAWILKSIAAGKDAGLTPPPAKQRARTNFIR